MNRICFLPLYQIERPSSRYRVFQFLPGLQAQGFAVSVVPAPERRLAARLFYLPRLLWAAQTHDVLFLQKRTLPAFVLKLVRRLNGRIIFDLDDAVYLRREVDGMLQTAVAVIAGNKTIAQYARTQNPNVTIIPTVVDTERYKPAAHKDAADHRIVLGWIGSDPNRGDFAGMQPVLDWLGETYGANVVLRIIAARTLEMDTALTIEWVPWSLEGDVAALQSIDIGLMPLPDTAWNRGKCGFKLIQYMAVEATAVASPVGVNTEIIQDGVTGLLARNEIEWQHALAQLIKNGPERTAMGEAARRHIEANYSVTAVLPQLTALLNQVAVGARS